MRNTLKPSPGLDKGKKLKRTTGGIGSEKKINAKSKMTSDTAYKLKKQKQKVGPQQKIKAALGRFALGRAGTKKEQSKIAKTLDKEFSKGAAATESMFKLGGEGFVRKIKPLKKPKKT